MTCSQPRSRSRAARWGLETTPMGVPPPLSTYCTAKLPIPPVAPQIRTRSPWVTGAPLRETSMRYAVELHSACTADSSQVRWVGLGMSWFALTTQMSARPPKFVSNPQMRWLLDIIESS